MYQHTFETALESPFQGLQECVLGNEKAWNMESATVLNAGANCPIFMGPLPVKISQLVF